MTSERKKRWIRVAGVLALVAALGAGGVAWRASGAHTPAPAVPPAEESEDLVLTAAALEKNPIATTEVVRAKLAPDLEIVGSVATDQDHYAVVGPLVSGRVVTLRAGVGARVGAGQILGEIESAEVGEAQAAYLTARARAAAAQANARRERELAEKRISSERDREAAEATAVSDAAELEAAVERLRAFGLGAAEIQALASGRGKVSGGGRVALRAPIAGVVLSRQVTLGQAVERATDAFEVADLRHLWVLLDLYEKDLTRVHVGQKVELRTEALPGRTFEARVAYINPLVEQKTRTANVRIELEDQEGLLHPGQFVNARILGDPRFSSAATLVVPRRAVQTVEGSSLLFVRGPRGFRKQVVELGASGGERVEIRHGVSPGDLVATDGAFLLKSELLR